MAPLVKARENEAAHPAPREFQSRGTYQGLNCIKDGIPGQDWQWVDATSGDIGQAIASIEWAGNFVIGAGWGYCGQIACHGTSAIYWCNDVSSSTTSFLQYFRKHETDPILFLRTTLLLALIRIFWRKWLSTLLIIATNKSPIGIHSLAANSSTLMITTLLFGQGNVTEHLVEHSAAVLLSVRYVISIFLSMIDILLTWFKGLDG
jgi:hypothetical protein